MRKRDSTWLWVLVGTGVLIVILRRLDRIQQLLESGGLAVSYGIVRAHGGDLTVESRHGDGAVFRVVLPRGATR